MTDKEKAFLERADAHIFLANDQIKQDVTPGEVSSSFLYGAARFSAWIAACAYESSQDMAAGKEEAIEHFVQKYKSMLEEHLDNHIEKFDFGTNS